MWLNRQGLGKIILINAAAALVVLVLTFLLCKEPLLTKGIFFITIIGLSVVEWFLLLACFYFWYLYCGEILFQVMTMFFMAGSAIGLIVMNFNVRPSEIAYLGSIPVLTLFLISLYIRLYVWKIDRKQYLNNRRQKIKDKIVI